MKKLTESAVSAIKRGKIEKIGAFDDVLGGDGGAYVEDGGER